MGTRGKGRLGRLFGREDEPEQADDDDSVALSGIDDHAWWADRRSLSGAPVAAVPTFDPTAPASEPAGEERVADTGDRWSAEALFADFGFDPTAPPAPPPHDDGATTAIITTSVDEARLVLGVTPDQPWKIITQVHRKLALQYHPDRLGDLSPEAQQLGQQRMAEINRALDTLREHLAP